MSDIDIVSPSAVKLLGRLATIVRLLVQDGLTDEDLQEIIDNRESRKAVINALRKEEPYQPWRVTLPLTPVDLDAAAVAEFTKDLHGHNWASTPNVRRMSQYDPVLYVQCLGGLLDIDQISVLIQRFGLDGKGRRSQRLVAEIMDISVERVRMLERRMTILQHPKYDF